MLLEWQDKEGVNKSEEFCQLMANKAVLLAAVQPIQKIKISAKHELGFSESIIFLHVELRERNSHRPSLEFELFFLVLDFGVQRFAVRQ